MVASGCRFDEVASHTLSTIGTVSVTCAVRYDGRGNLIYSIATVAGRRRVADQPAPVDACYTRPMVDVPGPTGPGIDWEPGDEDYPFATVPGESALDYLRRWLDSATYARVERGGVRYVHEEDVANLFNHVTADVDLLRARLETFGDHVLVASDHRSGDRPSRVGHRRPPRRARHAPAARQMKVLVLHGVNLDMFGKRDPAAYGTITLPEIDARLVALGRELDVDVETFQTNAEGAMCERIHAAHEDGTAAVVINAGAWTHYSYAIRDALAILSVPIVEVHMSNVHAREAFREISVFSDIATGRIAGFGLDSYLLGLRAAVSSAASRG